MNHDESKQVHYEVHHGLVGSLDAAAHVWQAQVPIAAQSDERFWALIVVGCARDGWAPRI